MGTCARGLCSIVSAVDAQRSENRIPLGGTDKRSPLRRDLEGRIWPGSVGRKGFPELNIVSKPLGPPGNGQEVSG